MGPVLEKFLTAFAHNYFILKAMDIFNMFFIQIILRASADGLLIKVLAT